MRHETLNTTLKPTGKDFSKATSTPQNEDKSQKVPEDVNPGL